VVTAPELITLLAPCGRVHGAKHAGVLRST